MRGQWLSQKEREKKMGREAHDGLISNADWGLSSLTTCVLYTWSHTDQILHSKNRI